MSMKQRLKAALAAVGSVCALLGVPAAQGQTAGPDVIVGDLYDWANYTNAGPVNGKRAYSVGTISCNLGDTPLTWNDNTTVYPVISGNMYRLMNGRFEQIGQSWLKHAFCALQGNVCATCSPGGNCDALFPGCSDPYSAGLNGTQSGLGPKWEVNASTGVFPLNWTQGGTVEPGDTGQTIYKRIQCLDSELGNAGALYFTSSSYIQPEDASFGNDNNNQSYRRITINSSTKAATLVDTTQRTKPAIQAWRDHGLGVGVPDPDVTLSNLDIANDGRFIVGVKVTNIGGDNYSYEYAVQNLNSYRGGASFTIPLPASAVVTNAAFRDVFYHSGEPQNGTDWAISISGSAITWTCTETHAANPNANALHWDTIYNFRFTTNVPPTGGVATLGLFRPGTPTSATVGTVIPNPAGGGTFTPPNNTCAGATGVDSGTTAFSSVNATTDGPDEPGPCTVSGYSHIGNDIWYRWTNGPTAGTATVSLCGSGFDTKMAVYASCPGASGLSIACNDDSSTCGTGSLQSHLTFAAAANTQYLIRIGGYQAQTGSGQMTITPPDYVPPPPPPAPTNNLCANAIFVADGQVVNTNNSTATTDATVSCVTSGRDLWFAYRPTTTGQVNIQTCGSNFDTVLGVFASCGGAQLACDDDDQANLGPCSASLQSYIRMNMTANTTYLIRVAGYGGTPATGDIVFRLNGGGGVGSPLNNDCANRAGLGLGASAFTTVNATTDGPTHTLCNFNGDNQITNDVWFNHPATFTGNLKIDTCAGAGFNTKLAVYSGSGCADFNTRLMACSDDDACAAGRSSVTIPVVSGQDYTIRVGGFNGASGAGTITLSPVTSCGTADFDGDGDTGTDADIEAFFACLGGNCCPTCGSADFDTDGDTGTDADIEAFFRVLGGGVC